MFTLEDVANANERLEERYADKLRPSLVLNRALVSFQSNKNEPNYRWFNFKEGFSARLVRYFLDELGVASGKVLVLACIIR